MEDIAESWGDFPATTSTRSSTPGTAWWSPSSTRAPAAVASGTPVSRQVGVLVQLRGGQIVSTRYHVTPDAAFAAAGIEARLKESTVRPRTVW